MRKEANNFFHGRTRKKITVMFSHSNGETLAIKLVWLSHLQYELNGLMLPNGEYLECSVFRCAG